MAFVRGHTLCWSAASVLSLVGLALATYLSVAYLSGAGVACGVSGGCGAVTTSEYSRFLGVPVALLRRGLAGIACAGFAFSAYLTATQAFLIGSYCVYCLTSAALMTALMVVTVSAAVRRRSVRQPVGH